MTSIPTPAESHETENVVARLRHRIDQAKRQGFHVRIEVLGDEQPGWCQVGTKRLIFLDLSQTAAEQLAQLNETLASFTAIASESATSRAA